MSDPYGVPARPWWERRDEDEYADQEPYLSRGSSPLSEGGLTAGLVAVAVFVGVLGALAAGADPTGNRWPDVILTAALAGAVVVSSVWCPPWITGVAAGVAIFLPQPPVTRLCAVLAVAAAAAAWFGPMRFQLPLAAASGALLLQSALRLRLDEPHGLATVVAAALLIPVLGAAWVDGPRWLKALIGIPAAALGVITVVALVGGAAVAVDSGATLTEAEGRTEDALDAFRNGDTAQASVGFATLAADLDGVAGRLNRGPARFARWVPVLAQHSALLQQGAAATAELADSAGTAVRRVDPTAVRVVEGRLDLERLAAAAAPLADLQTEIQLTRTRLQGLDDPWVLRQVEDQFAQLDTNLATADDDLSTALLASRSLPGLLGATGPARYLVVFTDGPDTGKVQGWASVIMDKGQLTVESASVPAALPDGGASLPAVLPGATVATSSKALVQAITPTLPVGGPLRGVVTAGPDTVAALGQLVGPVPVDALGITVKPDELETALTNPDPNVRLAVAVSVLAALGRSSLPGPAEAGAVLSGPAGSGDLLVWVDDAGGQELADRLGVSGL